jgi:hypothetical protein
LQLKVGFIVKFKLNYRQGNTSEIDGSSRLTLIAIILGIAIRTLEFPPNSAILASTSPNALDTYIIK